mmetsp:Transcript_42990/g.41356  ORF Transcript_42990/g.41356 Transcript_42990/m.41356 type:complete len:159 (-) Transcript_42990:331-807(-)
MRVSRQRAQQRQIDCCIFEMIYAFLVFFLVAVFVIAKRNTDCALKNTTIKSWLVVAIGAYLADFILLMAQFHNIKKTHKESVVIILIRFIVNCFLVAWLIFGNVIYYAPNLCQQEAYQLWVIMFLVLLIGYFEMMKCCCIGSCICILIPVLCIYARRA